MPEEMTQEEIDSLLAQMAGGAAPAPAASKSAAQPRPGTTDASGGIAQKEVDVARAASQTAFKSTAMPTAEVPFARFDGPSISQQGANDIGMILDVPMEVTVELGRTLMYIKDVLTLGPGSVVEIDRLAGEPIELLVNGKVIAKGEVVVIGEKFGLRITELLNPTNEANKNN